MSSYTSWTSGLALRLGAAGRVLLGACVGAAGGLAGTALILRSFEAGIVGAVGGALVAMIGALMASERADA